MARNKSEIQAVRQEAIDNNPCFEESEKSRRCLENNNYNYDSCNWYFENFKQCKKFWNEVKWKRQIEGIEPSLPPPEERKKIKAEFMEQLHKS